MYIFAQNIYFDSLELDEILHLASGHISLLYNQIVLKLNKKTSKQYSYLNK